MSSPAHLELGAAQRGIWNAQLLDPASPYYVVGEVLELEGLTPGADGRSPVDILAEAVRLTVDESETLRLRFTDTPDGPRQYVDDTPAPLPEVRDLSDAPDPRLLASAVIDAEKASCGEHWCTMTGGQLHRYLILDLGWTGGDPDRGRTVWCIQLYHHIIVDGYSAALLTRRTAAHYAELAGGRPARRNRFSPVADIVAADRDYTTDEGPSGRDADRAFWHDYLTPAPDTTGREDHVHGAGTSSTTTTLRITAAEMDALRTRAQSQGLVWSDLVMAAYGAWLRKLGLIPSVPSVSSTGSDAEALLAMPMMARTSGVLRRTPAMLVNMLPVRFPVRGDATLDEVAAEARAALDTVRPHQRFPGSELARDLGHPAVLHGIGLNLKTFDFSLDFNGTVGVLRNIAGGPPEDLVLVVTPAADGGTDIAFETDPRSVDAPTALRRLRDIHALLFDVPGSTPLSQIRLRDAETRARTAAARAGEPLPRPVPALDGRIDSLASRDGWEDETRPLLVSDDGATELTAAQTAARVAALARTLSADTPPGSVIALDLPKSPELAVAVLAVWRAHRAFVILDREHPQARRARILTDSGAVAVLGESAVLRPTGVRAPSADDVEVPDLAYLLYTSGTTGTPKGVQITRSAVEALLAGHSVHLWKDAWSRSVDGRLDVAHTASFSFDAALDQLAWIFTGATVHLYDRDTVGDPAAMRAALLRDRISVLDATPSLAGALIDSGALGSALESSDVSTVILGGEAVPQSLWDRLVSVGGDSGARPGRFGAWNVYGPTESTVDALMARVAPGPVNIGRAVPGTVAEILDVDGEPVPDNETGELYLSGPQTAVGYRGMPERTAEVFDTVRPARPDPDGPQEGKDATGGVRRYRTGDLVRWVPGRGGSEDSGATLFLGRADDQLEIRGHRVEPGEVEAALLALPEVTAAAVGTFGEPGALRLVAHVCLTREASSQVPPFDVRSAVAATVPSHLVPTRVRVHDRLPLTVGGKVDRRALEEWEALNGSAGGAAGAAGTPAADAPGLPADPGPGDTVEPAGAGPVLAEVLAPLLGLSDAAQVPLDRDFISLGGDSIAALTASGRLRMRGYAVPAREFLTGTLLSDIATSAEPVTPAGALSAPTSGAVSGTRPAGEAGGGTAVATGALPTVPLPADTALCGTLHGIDPELGLPGGRAGLLAAVQNMMTTHGALRAVFDPTGDDGPRFIVPRTPLTVPDAVICEAPAGPGQDAALTAALQPERGLVWQITPPDAEGEVRVCVHRGVLDPGAADIFLGELHRALTGLPLQPSPGSWRAAAQLPVRVAPVTGSAASPLVFDLPDPEALTELLPEQYGTGVGEVLTALASLATGAPVGLRDRPSAARGVLGSLTRTRVVPAAAGASDLDGREGKSDRAKSVLLGVKEAFRTGRPAEDTPALTVSSVPGSLLPAGRVLLTAGAPHLLVSTGTGDAPDTGQTTVLTARLYQGSPELVERLTGAAVALAVLARTGQGGCSPSDLVHLPPNLRPVSRDLIDLWEGTHGPLADVLPLSPLQEGLLYHAVAGGDGYVLSAGIDLAGEVDVDRLHDAFRAVLRRHGLLRARFDSDSLDEPVQLIPRRVTLPWRTVDFSHLPADAAAGAGKDRLRAMAARRIDLATGPLVAAELILLPRQPLPDSGPGNSAGQTAGPSAGPSAGPGAGAAGVAGASSAVPEQDLLTASACLVLGNHHLLTDGWSTPVMVRDLLALYHGDPLPEAAPYSDYLDWLASREDSGETAADEDAWRERLAGLDHGTLIRDIAPATPDDLERAGRVTGESVDELTVPDSLAARARHAGVTVNTLLQTAWSLTLAALTGADDIVSGTTVSGRPTQLPGIEDTVGLFINTLPARVTLDPSQTLTDTLRNVGRIQARMTAHDQVPLSRIEQLAGAGALFDSLVVVDNFPSLPPVTGEQLSRGRIGVTDVQVDGMTSFPVSVVSPPAAPGEPVRVVLAHRPDLVDSRFVDAARTVLTRVLGYFADAGAGSAGSAGEVTEAAEPTVGDVLAGLPRWTREDATTAPAPAHSTLPAHTTAVTSHSGGRPAADEPDPDEVSSTVARVMASLLKKDHVGEHDNFFDIGGHSLLAMRLLGRLRREGLENVTIQDIVETGSPAALAARLSGGGSSQILPLGPGTRTPLFAVHPGGGFALPFRGLADRLSAEDVPVTGLQLPDPHPEVTDLSELASGYVDSVMQVQDHGPYRLLGYSFGGVLAQAMTAELLRRGEQVSWLGIMDAYPAGHGPVTRSTADAVNAANAAGTADAAGRGGNLTAAQIAAVAGVPDIDDLPGGAEAADAVTRTLGANLAYCDGLLRSASPVDLSGFTGVVQLIVATRADPRVAGLHGAPGGWDPATAWAGVLDTPPRVLELDLTHAGLATDAGWDASTPSILKGLQ